MSRRPSRKLFLADLILASLLSGLFVALFTSAGAPTDSTIVFFLIVVVITTWSLFHQRRQAPTREECGRRFIYSALARSKDRPCEACRSTIPVEVVSGPQICPRCRLRHLRPAEAKKEHAMGLGSLVILLLILSIPIALSLRGPAGSKVAGSPFLGLARLIPWSTVEYQREASSSGELPADIGGLLVDQQSKTEQEGSFQDHIGRSFAPLLEEWRRWVMGQGIGCYEPSPSGIGDALRDRVLRVIRDPRSRLGNRILAIREWAHTGYVLGADALIDLLRDPRDIPKEEVVWALCMVSGMAWGDEPERWRAWWDGLPLSWDRPAEVATT